MNSAASYITEHADALKTVYVRAVANYALTLHNSHSMTSSQQSLIYSLEKTSREIGNTHTHTQFPIHRYVQTDLLPVRVRHQAYRSCSGTGRRPTCRANG